MLAKPAVHRSSLEVPSSDPGPVVTIGTFDGVHRGHQALVARARALAGAEGRVCAFTFDPSPRDVMRPDHGVPTIQSVDDRVAWLGRAGADDVLLEPFSLDYAQRSAEDFAHEVLRDRLGATGVVVGWDFRFGRGRGGGVDTLRAALDIPVVQVEAVEIAGAPVSSTRIRQRVRDGDVSLAAQLLGRPHELVGTVVRGDGRGRTLGIPTANVRPDTELCPAPGVYAVRATWDGGAADGVANLGDRPTYGPTEGRLEVHLFDVDVDLYGRELRVGFVSRIRGEQRFDGVEALVAQIHDDIATARRVLEGA